MSRSAVVVRRPLGEVYDEWTDTVTLSRRLGDDIEVEPLSAELTRWTVRAGGLRHEAVVREIDRSACRDIAWLSLSGPRLAGRVSFRPMGRAETCVGLTSDFDPRTPAGWVADSVMRVPEQVLRRVLERFRDSVEAEHCVVDLRDVDIATRGSATEQETRGS